MRRTAASPPSVQAFKQKSEREQPTQLSLCSRGKQQEFVRDDAGPDAAFWGVHKVSYATARPVIEGRTTEAETPSLQYAMQAGAGAFAHAWC